MKTCSKKVIENAKNTTNMLKGKKYKQTYSQLLIKLDNPTKRELEMAKEKDSSSWLPTLP